MRNLWLSLLILGVSGCAAQNDWPRNLGLNTQGCSNTLTQEQELSLNLAEDVAREGKRHAALAHFESLPAHVPQVRLNKAKVLRQLNQPGAEALYQSLLNTCLAASGYQGLGQLAFAKEQYSQAYQHLHQAVRLAPTDASMRNDYALVLLALGDRTKARFEFATALELEPTQKRSAINLASLLLIENQWDQVAALSAEAGLTAQEMRLAQQQAELYRKPRVASVGPVSAKESSITETDIAQVLQATKEQP